MRLHYHVGPAPDETACGLRGIPAARLAADLDAVDCGNCLSSLPWRNGISQRDYREQYEKFYGPGGFLDRAGQTTPASATTAPQARGALEQVSAGQFERIADLVRAGAGADIISRAVRESVRVVMTGTDLVLQLAIREDRAATATGERNGNA